MITVEIGEFNKKRTFEPAELQKLGKYVYALRDPRDGKIFYIGQGEKNRIFDHFYEAEQCYKKHQIASSKIIRILDIWNNKEDVDWFIVAHQLDDKSLDLVESAAIDLLGFSQNGITLNDNKAPNSSVLTQEDLQNISAKPINPDIPLEKVFVFPIQNALAEGYNAYDSTRKIWYIKKEYQSLPAYAVGLKNGISVGGYKIEKWKKHNDKHEFVGTEFNDLVNKRWSSIINQVKGYWQRGNYLIVEFDGNGQYRILRGAGQNSCWNTLEV